MAVTYRAIWQDDSRDIVSVTVEAFRDWAIGKHPTLSFDPDGTGLERVSDDGRRVWATQVEAAGETGQAVELILREDSDSDRWITTVRVTDDGERWVWVDVEHNAEDPWAPRPRIVAPRLVTDLISAAAGRGGDPRWGVIRLSATAVVVHPDAIESMAINRIHSPHRRSPEVVFAHSFVGGAGETMARAERAAVQLAGAASVLVLPEHAVEPFNDGMGEEHGLDFGQVRLYLPGEVHPHRNRILDRRFVARHTSAAAIQMGLFLQPAMANRKPPEALDRAVAMLRRSSGSSDADLLEVAEIEIEAARGRIASLEGELERARSEGDDRIFEIMERDALIASHLQVIDSYRFGAGEISEADAGIPAEVLSISEAVEQARLHLKGITIPDGAYDERDLEELDQTPTATAWGNTTWRGLRALNSYARESAAVEGGFREWCAQGGPDAWPTSPKKFSAVESDYVRGNEFCWKHRLLPVSIAVDPSGRIYMESHLKIAEGGGEQAPRVYFMDDTGGPTGKIHVGFIGPHRHMPNKKTS